MLRDNSENAEKIIDRIDFSEFINCDLPIPHQENDPILKRAGIKKFVVSGDNLVVLGMQAPVFSKRLFTSYNFQQRLADNTNTWDGFGSGQTFLGTVGGVTTQPFTSPSPYELQKAQQRIQIWDEGNRRFYIEIAFNAYSGVTVFLEFYETTLFNFTAIFLNQNLQNFGWAYADWFDV